MSRAVPLAPGGTLRTGLEAGALGAVLGGLPSTIHALATGRDPLEATKAAGTILAPGETSPGRLLLAATPAHLALSFGWAVVLARLLPDRREPLFGALGGLAIAALDLGLIARRFPRVRALPQAPQLADHLAFGALVGAAVARRRRAAEL